MYKRWYECPKPPLCNYLNTKEIGKNCAVYQSTTIGNKQDNRNDLVPVIGVNVTVSAHSVIICKNINW